MQLTFPGVIWVKALKGHFLKALKPLWSAALYLNVLRIGKWQLNETCTADTPCPKEQ
jgi:hypothetical protein